MAVEGLLANIADPRDSSEPLWYRVTRLVWVKEKVLLNTGHVELQSAKSSLKSEGVVSQNKWQKMVSLKYQVMYSIFAVAKCLLSP